MLAALRSVTVVAAAEPRDSIMSYVAHNTTEALSLCQGRLDMKVWVSSHIEPSSSYSLPSTISCLHMVKVRNHANLVSLYFHHYCCFCLAVIDDETYNSNHEKLSLTLNTWLRSTQTAPDWCHLGSKLQHLNWKRLTVLPLPHLRLPAVTTPALIFPSIAAPPRLGVPIRIHSFHTKVKIMASCLVPLFLIIS